MAGVNITVEINIGDLDSALDTLRESISKGIEDVFDETAKGAKAYMDSLTPVRTGHLRDGNEVTQEQAMTITVSNRVSYAAYVNYGTRYQTAQPFFEPTLDWITQELADNLSRAIE